MVIENATAVSGMLTVRGCSFLAAPVCCVVRRKEDLWPHVREFADRAIAHASATLARLQESGPCELYIVHGHYADAGEVAGLISSTLGVDCVLTGHSLGRNKKEHLLKSGTYVAHSWIAAMCLDSMDTRLCRSVSKCLFA